MQLPCMSAKAADRMQPSGLRYMLQHACRCQLIVQPAVSSRNLQWAPWGCVSMTVGGTKSLRK